MQLNLHHPLFSAAPDVVVVPDPDLITFCVIYCFFSLCLLFIICHLSREWKLHQGREVFLRIFISDLPQAPSIVSITSICWIMNAYKIGIKSIFIVEGLSNRLETESLIRETVYYTEIFERCLMKKQYCLKPNLS